MAASLQHYEFRSWWKCLIITAMCAHTSQRNPSSVLGTWAPYTRSKPSMCNPGSWGCWWKSRKSCISLNHMQWRGVFLELPTWTPIHLGSIFCPPPREGPQHFHSTKIHSLLSKHGRQHHTEEGVVCTLFHEWSLEHLRHGAPSISFWLVVGTITQTFSLCSWDYLWTTCENHLHQ